VVKRSMVFNEERLFADASALTQRTIGGLSQGFDLLLVTILDTKAAVTFSMSAEIEGARLFSRDSSSALGEKESILE